MSTYYGNEDEDSEPTYEAEDRGCQCTEAGIESEWVWNKGGGYYQCSGCGDVQ